MKRYILFLTVFLTSNSYAVDAERLAQKSGCLACHSVDKKVLGPAFSWVAAKYKDDPNYLTTLSNKVKNGGSGVWGPMPMPSNKQISDENIATLVTWIVTGIEPSTNPNPTTTANSSTTKSNSSSGSAVLGVLGAVAGVYLDNQVSKSNQNSNSGEAVKSSATPKYYEPSSQRIARNVNHCIGQRTKEKSIHFVNNCNFDIHMAYCHLNNENTDVITHACDGWSTNEIKLKPGEVSYYSLKTGSAQIMACRDVSGGEDNYSRLGDYNITQNLWPQKSKIDTYYCAASPQYR